MNINTLLVEGLEEYAKKLKKVKYILISYKATLIEKDQAAVNYNKDLNEQPDTLLKKRALPKANDNFARYMDLIKNNKLFLVCDTIKEELKYAYKSSCKIQMLDSISSIIKICKGTCNTHFQRFARLLSNHIEGIITHAIYKVTNGKIEGINQRIKTLKRKSYGLPKDLYFFLKLMHESRKTAQGHLNPTILASPNKTLIIKIRYHKNNILYYLCVRYQLNYLLVLLKLLTNELNG